MCPLTNFKDLVDCSVMFLMTKIVPLLVGLAVVLFLWGLFKFVRNSADEKTREEGKQLMLWGVIGLFAMLCVWAFVAILANTFFGGDVVIPQL